MKKSIFSLCALATSYTLFALPLGNPADPQLYSSCGLGNSLNLPCQLFGAGGVNLTVGYTADAVLNRNLYTDTVQEPILRKKVDLTTLGTEGGFLSLNFSKCFSVFGRLGKSKMGFASQGIWNTSSLSNQNERQTYLVTDAAASWSVGGRMNLLNCDRWILGVEGEYFHTRPHAKTFAIPELFPLTKLDQKLSYKEWQLGIGLAYQICSPSSPFSCVPYIGVKRSHVFLKTYDLNILDASYGYQIKDMRDNKGFGAAAGMSIVYCGQVGCTVEGRWGDEKAVHINSKISF